MSTDDLRVSHFNSGDRGALLEFYGNVWTPPAFRKNPAWLDWSLAGNPYVHKDKLPLILAWSGDRIVGHLMLIPTCLWNKGMPFRVAWGRDLFVDPLFRRKKIALSIYDECIKTYPIIMGSGHSESHRQLMDKYGWIRMRRFCLNERLLPSLQTLRATLSSEPGKLLKRLSAMTYGSLTAARIRKRRSRVEQFPAFDPDDGGLWDFCKKSSYNICARDPAFLVWRFNNHPYYSYTVFKSYDETGRLTGYAVVRLENGVAFVVDFLTRNDCHHAGSDLIDSIIEYASRTGVARIVCRSVCMSLEHTLKKYGFLSTKFNQDMMILSRAEFPKSPEWYVTAMDSDQDR